MRYPIFGLAVFALCSSCAEFLEATGQRSSADRPELAEYYRTHPMAECRELVEAFNRREAFTRKKCSVYAAEHGCTEPPPTKADPCALGCRIPACGYPPSPQEM